MQIISNNEGRGLAHLLGATLVSTGIELDGIVQRRDFIDTEETVVFAGTGFGSTATELSAKRPVFGASLWTDRINDNPDLMFALASQAGMSFPTFHILKETDGPLSAAYERISQRVYIKKEGGIRLSCEAFFADGTFKSYFAKYHGDRILYNNEGPKVGRSTCLIFSQPNTVLRKHFEALAPIIALEAPEYRGPVTIEARIIGSEVRCRSIRFGYDFDFEYAKIALCGKEVLTGKSKSLPTGFGSTIRLCDIRREEFEAERVVTDRYCVPVGVKRTDDGRVVTCAETVAICVGLGEKIRDSFDNCLEAVRRVKTVDMCYRPDGGSAALHWWKEAQKEGILK